MHLSAPHHVSFRLEVDPSLTKESEHKARQAALRNAAEAGDVEYVQSWLAEHKTLIDAPIDEEATLLIAAARGGQLALVKMLLESGAKVDVPASLDGCTALMAACRGRHPKLVTALLEAGANPTVRSQSGKTCLDVLQDVVTSEVIVGAVPFVRFIGCVKAITDHCEALDRLKWRPRWRVLDFPDRRMGEREDRKLADWERVNAAFRSELDKLVNENSRREVDQEAKLSLVFNEAVGINLFGMQFHTSTDPSSASGGAGTDDPLSSPKSSRPNTTRLATNLRRAALDNLRGVN